MIKRIMAAIAASVAIAIPAYSRVDPGTMDLIRTAEQYGATFEYNTRECGERFKGRYRLSDKRITLCYSGVPGADGHDTVRHEVFHFIQHCRAIRSNYKYGLMTLSSDNTLRTRWVAQYLTPSKIKTIKRIYPAHQHQVELEAFAAAAHYTATDLQYLVRSWCLR